MVSRFMKVWPSLMLLLLLPATIHAEDIYAQVKADIRADRTQAALQTLRSMVKRRPDDYQAWFLYGVASAHQQQDHEAIEAFRHVIDLNPKLAEPHDNLAVIYNKMGDEHAAIEELEQSLKKRPDYAVTQENLADLYVKMAIKNYRRALKKEPTPQLERRYMRLLQVRNPDLSAGRQEKVKVIPAPQRFTSNDKASVAAQVETSVAGKEPVDAPLPETAAKISVEKAVEITVSETEKDDTDGGDEAVWIGHQALTEQVLQAVEHWRSAWSAQQLAAYFSFYADDYQVPDRFETRQAWQTYKKRVIGTKSYIKIEISDMKVQLAEDGKRAEVKFFQKFHSNSYNSAGSKILKMRLDDGSWKIVKEESAS